MRKLLSAIIFIFFLSGCGSSPSPKPIPSSKLSQINNEIIPLLMVNGITPSAENRTNKLVVERLKDKYEKILQKYGCSIDDYLLAMREPEKKQVVEGR